MTLFSLEGKTALVTGGGRGIGYMIADGFVTAGVKVYISSRKAQVCADAAEELSRRGTCVAIPADLSREDECRRLAEEISGREESLDILVNNAGATWGAPLSEFPDSAWSRVMDLNVKGVFTLTRFLIPLLRAAAGPRDPSRVINIGSVDGIKVPAADNFSYAASKAAVHHLTRVLASHLAPMNITANAIAPGPFKTKMTAQLLRDAGPRIIDACPMRRLGEPEDIAGASIFLASRAASYITGVVLPVDGGISSRN